MYLIFIYLCIYLFIYKNRTVSTENVKTAKSAWLDAIHNAILR